MEKASVAIIKAKKTNRVLLLLRPVEKDDVLSGTWTFVAGKLEKNEEPIDAIKREIEEELTFYSYDINFVFLGSRKNPEITLYYYMGWMKDEQIPILNEENDDWGWFSLNNLPQNIFPESLKMLNMLHRNPYGVAE